MDMATKQRIERAAKDLEDALNADGGSFAVEVTAVECTSLHDERKRFRYLVSIEHMERIR